MNDNLNNQYKFNGKEQDGETGYYYYGARYYNPRVSLWLNVDPLADYNPFYNNEHYIDGQHNGGVYNSGNLNPYIYCYQKPVIFVDPNGKQVHFMHGTGDRNAKTYFSGLFANNFKRDFGSFYSHQWSGALSDYNDNGRISEGHRISKNVIASIDANVRNGKYEGNGIVIGGHSHGANVARILVKDLYNHLKNKIKEGTLDKMPIINLVMVNAPVLNREEYEFEKFAGIHINVIQVDSYNDLVAGSGQLLNRTSTPINEKYDDADFLFEYKDQIRIDFFGCGMSNHCGQEDENVKVWYDRVKINIQKGTKQ